MTRPPDWPNMNYVWAGLLVEELVRLDVAGFVLSPGSRNAPLSISVARHPLARHWTHLDERGAAFFALGLAKQSGRPAVLICTSGSAAANYWPAVVEASASGIPLVIVSADRPPELLDCGANQAIEQPGLFGNYVRWTATLPCPDAAIAPAYVLTTADQAIHRSESVHPGPVHLNCMFREPLAPDRDESVPNDYLAALGGWLAGETAYTQYTLDHNRPTDGVQTHLLGMVQAATAGLLVFGALESGDIAPATTLARQLGWPVFADICSGLRGSSDLPGLLDYGDLVLLDPALDRSWSPDLILHIGGPVTSKRFQALAERTRPGYIRVCSGSARLDPGHLVTIRSDMPVVRFCGWLAACTTGHTPPEMPDSLVCRHRACVATLSTWDRTQDGLSEIGVTRVIAREAPAQSLLYLANSMPVRLMDSFGAPAAPDIEIVANRGASGIDGNIATAAGMALASERPVTALIGDLALLHDLNSLALLRHVASPFVLVAINNDGGGIFHHLPIAAYPDVFEPCFGTPHGLSFSAAASLFNIDYQRPQDLAAFAEVYRVAHDTAAPTLIEVAVDREASLTLHRALAGQLQSAMAAGSG